MIIVRRKDMRIWYVSEREGDRIVIANPDNPDNVDTIELGEGVYILSDFLADARENGFNVGEKHV